MNKKVEGWYKRHKDLKIKQGWNKEEYDYILEKILTEDYEVLQDLLPYLHKKTINDLVELLESDLIIGNKKKDIELFCSNCGKKIIRNMAEFKKERVYCNMKCRDENRVKLGIMRGKNSPQYNSQETICTNCNKPLLLPKYKIERVNRFGDNHNFCSQKCYWEYRSKYYVGEKSSMYNYIPSDKAKRAYRERTVKMFQENKFPTKMTSIHKKINSLLDELNIKYINEYSCKYYSIDIYLCEYNLMIEIMGDYFHANPIKYKNKKLNKMQLKDIKKDKAKHTYVKRYKGIEILYLWEYDINYRLDICKHLILEYIKNKGILSNYHSYNY